jgi:hypothetical protein
VVGNGRRVQRIAEFLVERRNQLVHASFFP